MGLTISKGRKKNGKGSREGEREPKHRKF